jgi:hypothetical protein
MAGFLKVRLPELELQKVGDPRHRRGRRWKLSTLLRATLVAMMAGAKSLAEVEMLTDNLSVATRKLLGIRRRVADTTLRDVLCRLDIHQLRAVLHRVIKLAVRRKALVPVGLPFGVVAMDGKSTAIAAWDDELAQRNVHEETHLAYGLMRTITACLVSARGQPCIDAIPLPPKTNEVGFFKSAFASLVETYGALFSLVTYDAGGASESNGATVVKANKHYLFRLRNESRLMLKLARDLLKDKPILAKSEDVLSNHKTVTRAVRLVTVAPTNRKRDTLCWSHTKTLLCVTSVTTVKDKVVRREERFYNSSLAKQSLSADQWLSVVRAHWGVENHGHYTYDAIFCEDQRPFITYSPQGMAAALLLRRIAVTLLTLFRSITQRSDDRRRIPWRTLITSLYNTLIAARPEQLDHLRSRAVIFA